MKKLFHTLKKHLSPKPSALLGIDVDHATLRIVELTNKTLEGFSLNTCTQVSLPASANFSWQHPDFPAFLKQVLHTNHITTRQVAIALPYTAVLFKTIELDKKLTEAEIALQVKTKAEQYFNYSIAELMLDFEILGDSKNHPDLQEIRWVVAKRADVQPKINALQAAGLIPTVVEIDIHALHRALNKELVLRNNVIVIYFYVSQLLFSVIDQDKIIYTRIENYTASEAKTSAKISAVSRALNLFFNSATNHSVSHILLSGDAPCDLLADIQYHSNIETRFLDVNISPEKTLTHEFAISAGLAMRVNT